ncbi:DUF6646 family protein [Epilithonimonas caeni]|uniref:DUF6646 family protein n=1 Tax=Epilithonimonas caeni TaxID=365343 RepID=UPI000404AA37|nr:DUF6646 family protein [Epilithonimonas caeni]
MKKLLLTIGLFAGVLSYSQAWSGAGDQKVQGGFNIWGFGTGVAGSYDYGINSLISLGGGANVYFNEDEDNPFVFGRIGFHLQETLALPSELDIYPGVNMGVAGRNFGLGIYIGARYFFTENWGAFVEAGNNGSLGVSYSF